MSLHLSQNTVSAGSQLRSDDLKTRQIAQRWAVLAEQRLSYLTELFDSGRWRRFHNETDFLDNIQEAKSNLDRWRAMANGEFVAPPVVVNRAPQLKAILAAAAEIAPLLRETEREAVAAEPAPRDIERVLPHLVVDNDAVIAAEFEADAPPAAAKPVLAATHLDLFDRDAIVERYPMLRAAM